jgi:hypothetical protein
MWIMTSFGILMPSIRPSDTIEAGDNRVIQVRTRRRRDLDILREEYMQDTLGPTVFMKNTDYEYRAYCTREAWAVAMARMSLDIDYTKFKPTTENYKDHQLHMLYNVLWGVIQEKLSTATRIASYWHLDNKKFGRKTSRKKTKNTSRNWWDDLELTPDELDEALFDDVDTSDVDAITEPPYVMPNGHLDHNDCDHARTRNARRRCRQRWLKRVPA